MKKMLVIIAFALAGLIALINDKRMRNKVHN